ncbi:TATA-box-binding protein, partial [Candidatus Bathyarchaeota archaeon]|nr:TATA-box-binding protein [Candidatus Bathyarchaeota archaeon]
STTGNIVITGAKTEEQVRIAADKIRAILNENGILF